jgi:hypothetical protein
VVCWRLANKSNNQKRRTETNKTHPRKGSLERKRKQRNKETKRTHKRNLSTRSLHGCPQVVNSSLKALNKPMESHQTEPLGKKGISNPKKTTKNNKQTNQTRNKTNATSLRLSGISNIKNNNNNNKQF